MRSRRVFKSLIERTSAGRFRWVVSTRGETMAHGYAKSQIEARTLALDSQKELIRKYPILTDRRESRGQ